MPKLENIIGIHGAPRSGTSWLGQIFNSNEHVAYRYQPLFSYAFKERLTANSPADEIDKFFGDLLATNDDFVLQRGALSLARYVLDFPKAEITHLVYKEVRYHDVLENLLKNSPNFKAIGIVRNPCAVIRSWISAPREFNQDWSLEEEWRHAQRKNSGNNENWYGYERWKQLTKLYLHFETRYQNRFRIVRYEDLVAATEESARSLLDFCGLPCTEQTMAFIADSTSRNDHDPYGVFRCYKDHGSANQLPSAIVNEIKRDLEGTSLNRFLGTVD
jgi:hypothetical protein